MIRSWYILLFTIVLAGCGKDDGAKLPPVEVRVSTAIGDLENSLTSPANGWKLNYRPTSETGNFFILLDFNDDGTVRIQSDVTANSGEFRDHTISYRIDSRQGLELILETYGVFHYLFELQQNSFGAEFEFIYLEEQGGNLIFRSKTDQSDVTTLTFEPAAATDGNLITTDAQTFIRQGIFNRDNLGNLGGMGHFNFTIPANNHTISATFDVSGRVAKILGIAEGQDLAAITTTNNIMDLDLEVAFSLSNESVVLDEAQTFSFGGSSYTIDQIPIGNFSTTQDNFCGGQQETIVNLSGSASFGSFTAVSSPFQASSGFKANAEDTYDTNHIFIYNENDSSISDQIEAVFPDVVVFQWYYDFEIADTLANVAGFVTVDEFNDAEFYLRGFDVVQVGNSLQMTFNGKDLITNDDATTAQLNGLYSLMDEIFAGGSVYIMEIANQGGLFQFYNPCNKYKGFLLKPQ